MKKAFILMLLVLLLVILGLNVTMVFPTLETDAYISPNKDAIFMNTNIYFVYKDALRTENRRIKVIDSDYERAVIDAIIKGPKNIAYGSLFDSGVGVLSVDYANNTCYVNLPQEVLLSSEWQSERLDLYLWSVVNSLTEIKRVFKVQFLVDGERLSERVIGYSLDEPLSRLERLNYVKERTPADAVVEFIDNITATRYDLAYELLSENSKFVYDFNDFVKYANSLGDETFGFTRDMYFTKTYSDYWIIYIEFLKNVENKEFQSHFYKNWHVNLESGNYKIDLLTN